MKFNTIYLHCVALSKTIRFQISVNLNEIFPVLPLTVYLLGLIPSDGSKFDDVEWHALILHTFEVALAFCTNWSKWTLLTFVLNTVVTQLPLHILTQLPLTTIDRRLHHLQDKCLLCLFVFRICPFKHTAPFCPEVWLYKTQMFVSSRVAPAYANLLTKKWY